MGIQVDDELAGFLLALSGEVFPNADETAMRRLASTYVSAGLTIDELQPVFSSAVRRIAGGVKGTSHEALVNEMRQYTDPNGVLGIASRSTKQFGGEMETLATEVEYAKLMIIATLIELLVELATALAIAWFFPGIMSRLMANMIIARTRISLLLSTLMAQVNLAMSVSIGLQVAMDTIVQLVQIKNGTRRSFDFSKTRQMAAVGALGGAMGLGIGAVVGKLFGDDLARHWTAEAGKELSVETLSEGATELVYTAMTTGEADWGAVAGAFMSGAASAGAGGAGAAMGYAFRNAGSSSSTGSGSAEITAAGPGSAVRETVEAGPSMLDDARTTGPASGVPVRGDAVPVEGDRSAPAGSGAAAAGNASATSPTPIGDSFLPPSAGMSKSGLGDPATRPQPAPKIVHIVIDRDAAADAAVQQHLEGWKTHAAHQGWKVAVWADQAVVDANPGLGLRPYDAPSGVPPALTVLDQHGGLLVDVTVEPTHVDLPSEPVTTGTGPAAAPYLGGETSAGGPVVIVFPPGIALQGWGVQSQNWDVSQPGLGNWAALAPIHHLHSQPEFRAELRDRLAHTITTEPGSPARTLAASATRDAVADFLSTHPEQQSLVAAVLSDAESILNVQLVPAIGADQTATDPVETWREAHQVAATFPPPLDAQDGSRNEPKDLSQDGDESDVVIPGSRPRETPAGETTTMVSPTTSPVESSADPSKVSLRGTGSSLSSEQVTWLQERTLPRVVEMARQGEAVEIVVRRSSGGRELRRGQATDAYLLEAGREALHAAGLDTSLLTVHVEQDPRMPAGTVELTTGRPPGLPPDLSDADRRLMERITSNPRLKHHPMAPGRVWRTVNPQWLSSAVVPDPILSPPATTARDALATAERDWLSRSDAPFRQRSPHLSAVDQALTSWAQRHRESPNALMMSERELREIAAAIASWRDIKGAGGGTLRADHINRLDRQVGEALAEIGPTVRHVRAQAAESTRLKGLLERIDPDLADAVRREGKTPNPELSLHQALLAERDGAGRLTREAVRTVDRVGDTRLASLRDLIAGKGVTIESGLSDDRIREMLADPVNLNKLTGESRFPELFSYLADHQTRNRPENLRIERFSVGGPGTVTVEYDISDSMHPRRLDVVRSAMTRVRDAGFAIPDVTLRLPRYARDLVVSPDGITEGVKDVQRNEYLAGEALLTGHAVGNPIEGFLSTELSPDGEATIVHEMGHLLHHRVSPVTYADLNLTAFTAPARATAKQVSDYAANNAREFVAEVFMSKVYGRAVSPEVDLLYRKLAGPLSGAAGVPVLKGPNAAVTPLNTPEDVQTVAEMAEQTTSDSEDPTRGLLGARFPAGVQSSGVRVPGLDWLLQAVPAAPQWRPIGDWDDLAAATAAAGVGGFTLARYPGSADALAVQNSGDGSSWAIHLSPGRSAVIMPLALFRSDDRQPPSSAAVIDWCGDVR